MLNLFCSVLLLLLLSVSGKVKSPNYKEYCVIGAGPGGLQMAYFLHNAARNYIVFEKADKAGSFYEIYPIHQKLISINKRYTDRTNKEFNFRHDWNSLVSHDESLKMTKYTNEFFPPADTLVQYLNDFATKLNLKIQYNSTMHDVMKRDDKLFQMWDQHDNAYTCKYVIMATGIAKPNIPLIPGYELIEGYENLSTNLSQFMNQNVLVIGRGNAGHETAQYIYGVTNHVHMMSRSRNKLAWATHYVGHVRAVNNALLDTYHFNSLD
uniref:FAD/NAD(P)-binding domain-containing protein n=1 Tax=Ciona savignyi TaxID=51511 RepID=H2YH79_CIOSA